MMEKKQRKIDKVQQETKIRIGFWNVAGIKNKDIEFWQHIQQYDINWLDRNMGRGK